MPLVRIDLRSGKPTDYRRAIADAVHQSMVSELKAPVDDRFQVITEHDSDSLIYDPIYLDMQRSDEVIFIQITERGTNTGSAAEVLPRCGEGAGRSARDWHAGRIHQLRRSGEGEPVIRRRHRAVRTRRKTVTRMATLFVGHRA